MCLEELGVIEGIDSGPLQVKGLESLMGKCLEALDTITNNLGLGCKLLRRQVEPTRKTKKLNG